MKNSKAVRKTRKELVKDIAYKTGCSIKDTQVVLKTFQESLDTTIKK